LNENYVAILSCNLFGIFLWIPGSPIIRVVMKQELSSNETSFNIHSNTLC